MKKTLFSVLALATVLAFTNCKSTNTENLPPAFDKATITGTASAELDNTVAGTEKVPAGTKIYAKVYLNYNNNSSVRTSGYSRTSVKVYETTVDASGKYTFDIDILPNGYETYIEIKPADFVATVKTGASTSRPNITFSSYDYATSAYLYSKTTRILDFRVYEYND